MKRIIVLLLLLCGNISLNAQININPDPNGDPWIVGGIPIMIRAGVSKKPPPTPKRPDRKPTVRPIPSSKRMLTLTPAIGR